MAWMSSFVGRMVLISAMASAAVACRADPAPAGPPSGAEQVAGPLGDTLALPFGVLLPVEGTPLRLTFRAVEEDSRCPTGVMCVWRGNARVVIEASVDGGAPIPLLLNTAVDARGVSVGDWRVTLIGLDPWPVEGGSAPPEAHTARVTVVGPEG